LYLKKEKDLLNRKEKLFITRDFTQWMYTEGTIYDLMKHSDELFANKEKAFKCMLCKETKEINEMREELSFYTNQCLDEVRRVAKDNA